MMDWNPDMLSQEQQIEALKREIERLQAEVEKLKAMLSDRPRDIDSSDEYE